MPDSRKPFPIWSEIALLEGFRAVEKAFHEICALWAAFPFALWLDCRYFVFNSDFLNNTCTFQFFWVWFVILVPILGTPCTWVRLRSGVAEEGTSTLQACLFDLALSHISLSLSLSQSFNGLSLTLAYASQTSLTPTCLGSTSVNRHLPV